VEVSTAAVAGAVAAGVAEDAAKSAVQIGKTEDEMQSVTKSIPKRYPVRTLFVLAMLAAFCVSMSAGHKPAPAAPDQKAFTSPQQAVSDFVSAVKAHDKDQLSQILGPQGTEILNSGDPVADKQTGEQFLEKYDQMHRLVKQPDGSVSLYIGAENWPFPIPIVNRNGQWVFDTATGKREVLYRRIGRNEFATIDTLQSLVEAQKEYASQPRGRETVKQFAQKLLSDEGKQNGLFWKTGPGEPPSPIGPLIGQAAAEGYRRQEGPTPFHGYIYRLILSQGPNAPGGAMSYMVNGKLTRGFAIIAYPAEYRNSGVMTFIVNQDGKVYQKDLGPNTATVAPSITVYDPDKTWAVVED
jgi:hypothetical protein